MKHRKIEQNALSNNWKILIYIYASANASQSYNQKLKPQLTASPQSGESGFLRLYFA